MMHKSTNNFNIDSQTSTHSTSFQYQNSNQPSQETSMFASFLSPISPRNILKYFSKNEQKIQSQQTFRQAYRQQPQKKQIFSPRKLEINQFSKYTQSIHKQMQIYNNKRLKNKNVQKNIEKRNKQRQQIEQQIQINKIPQPYFRDWDHQIVVNQLDIETSQIITREDPNLKDLKQTHKSLKLRSLLIIAQTKDNKKGKFRKKLLDEKQTQIQGYLDQIQLLIFNKTRKYPDHYLFYLTNIQNSGTKVNQISEKTKICRLHLREQIDYVKNKQQKVIKLQKKKKNMGQLLNFMHIIKQVYMFKKQSQNMQNENNKFSINESQQGNKKTSNEIIKSISTYSSSNQLNKLKCIRQSLANIKQFDRNIKRKRLAHICDELKKYLQKHINSFYSRDSWLKQKPPKDSLLTDRMKPEMLNEILQSQENNINNSYLNISVLDQSYYVFSQGQAAKKQSNIFTGNSNKQIKCIMQHWSQYCRLYNLQKQKIDDQQQIIGQIFQRIVLRFTVKFDQDLEDYVAYIFAQNSMNTKHFPTFKKQLLYIQPKLFTKILKVLYQCLSTALNFALIFTILPQLCQKLLQIIQEKIVDLLGKKSLNDYEAIQNKLVGYEDVTEIASSFDYWFEFVENAGDHLQNQQDQGDQVMQKIIKFQQYMLNLKEKTVDQFLANLHKFALVSQLKNNIQKEDFSIISIPVSSFIMLDFIINWGQSIQTEDKFTFTKANEVQQSFYLNSSILGDNNPSIKKSQTFSIFKIIDKKLIIEGRQFKLCYSILILAIHLYISLRSKKDFKQLSAKIDQRICQLIGFYIWYCKKIVFSSAHSQSFNNQMGQSMKSTNNFKQTSLCKKTILNLCMMANICDLLTKLMDIFNITAKPKKVDKVLSDLKTIKQECFKQIAMLPFLQVERQISCLYQSRLKTRKQVPTKQSIRIIEILQQARKGLSQFFSNQIQIKKPLQNTVKVLSKNYFGYLHNMEVRGKAQLKWFFPKFKDTIQDIFPNQINNLQKQFKF